MGKKHMASKNQHAMKRPKISFRNLSVGAKSPTLIVVDYLFDDEHDDFSVSWLMRKLDRYKNDSSFTSDVSNVREEGDETLTSRLHTDFSDLTEEDPAYKKKLFEENADNACNEDVPVLNDRLYLQL